MILSILTVACGGREDIIDDRDPRCLNPFVEKTYTNDDRISNMLEEFKNDLENSEIVSMVDSEDLNRLFRIEFVSRETFKNYSSSEKMIALNSIHYCNNNNYFFEVIIRDYKESFNGDESDELKNAMRAFNNPNTLKVVVYHELMHIWFNHSKDSGTLMSEKTNHFRLTEEISNQLIENGFKIEYVGALTRREHHN